MRTIDGKAYYSLSDVCVIMKKTRSTILRWHEADELGILPSWIRYGSHGARYYAVEDINKFKEFANNKEYGLMTKVSNKYNGTNKRDKK